MKKETLQDLRLKTKLTQESASEKLNITKEYLSALERGVRNPSDTLKEKLAELYNVSIVKIFLACKETKCFKDK
jgi:putative transcriptional regulator